MKVLCTKITKQYKEKNIIYKDLNLKTLIYKNKDIIRAKLGKILHTATISKY